MEPAKSEHHSRSQSLDFLRCALVEAQTTVRAYDTKAQIVGVGYAFALGVVAATSDWFPKVGENEFAPVLIFWGVVMAPLILFGYVLYPTRKTAPKVENSSAFSLQQLLYIDPTRHRTVADIESAAASCDWLHEFSYELLKVSKLRELKRIRFIRALIASAIAFATLFAAQILARLQ